MSVAHKLSCYAENEPESALFELCLTDFGLKSVVNSLHGMEESEEPIEGSSAHIGFANVCVAALDCVTILPEFFPLVHDV